MFREMHLLQPFLDFTHSSQPLNFCLISTPIPSVNTMILRSWKISLSLEGLRFFQTVPSDCSSRIFLWGQQKEACVIQCLFVWFLFKCVCLSNTRRLLFLKMLLLLQVFKRKVNVFSLCTMQSGQEWNRRGMQSSSHHYHHTIHIQEDHQETSRQMNAGEGERQQHPRLIFNCDPLLFQHQEPESKQQPTQSQAHTTHVQNTGRKLIPLFFLPYCLTVQSNKSTNVSFFHDPVFLRDSRVRSSFVSGNKPTETTFTEATFTSSVRYLLQGQRKG